MEAGMARFFPMFPGFPKGRFQGDRRWNMIFFRIANLFFFDFVLAFFTVLWQDVAGMKKRNG